ncbi:hypothetical protein ABZY06_33830 [Streptomyces sp. NPDC006540]|uniref:hypothetical protein n=1 Tax=Streptomyces sp. NPDC006540 TaxID=3155353 RepID=UPI0033BE34D8
MAKRGVITDYAGEELHPGDLITYSARESNRVRSADAFVLRTKVEKFKGRCIPFLLVQPTGAESGFSRRKTLRKLTISSEHVRLIERGALTPEEVRDMRGERGNRG